MDSITIKVGTRFSRLNFYDERVTFTVKDVAVTVTKDMPTVTVTAVADLTPRPQTWKLDSLIAQIRAGEITLVQA